MDLNDEASKLLEKALSSFDGIILGTKKSSTGFSLTGCQILIF
jgi:hypothetical protein